LTIVLAILGSRVEIIIERDDLVGDGDEIELSLHPYLEGKPEPLPVIPRLIVSMKREKDVWKLNEVTLAVHVPLSDPDYLRAYRRPRTPTSRVPHPQDFERSTPPKLLTPPHFHSADLLALSQRLVEPDRKSPVRSMPC